VSAPAGGEGAVRRRFLVVEDSRAMRLYLRNILKDLDAEILECESAPEALQALAKRPELDLVVVDWNLPGMDGLSLVREIRKIPVYAGLCILMVTTEVEPAQVREALGAGVQEYLMKPFTPDMLLRKLQLLGLESTPGA
jgi:two-component system chemotaxis response regulator CheY